MYKFSNVFAFHKKSKIKAGDGKPEEKYPFYTSSTELNKYVDNYLFNGESLVFGTGGNASVHFAQNKFAVSTDCLVAQTNTKDVNPKFVYYYLSANIHILEQGFKGAGLKHISKAYISEITFPKFSRKKQDKIVQILETADGLRQKRKEQLTLLDDYLKSVFLDMFGDPVRNENEWNVMKMLDVCFKVTDGTHDTPRRLDSGVKFITGKHIRPFKIDYENSDYVSPKDHDEIYRRCNPEKGDILYTNIGVNTGTAAVNTVDYPFSMKNVALLKLLRHKVNSRYVESLLNYEFIRIEILRKSSLGGAQQFLGLQDIKKIDIPVPPIELQNRFASIIEKLERTKQKMRALLIEMDNHFNALMQRYFK